MVRDQHIWVVLTASFVTYMMNYGVMLNFGTLFVAMLNTFHKDRSTTAVVQSLFITFGMIFGVFTGLAITRFGTKPVIIIYNNIAIKLPFANIICSRVHDQQKWVVLTASFFTYMMNYGVMLNLGTLFVAMLNTFYKDRSTTAVVQSLFIAFGMIFGVFTGIAITRFGTKPVAFAGAILVPTGFIISFWATSILYFDISIGVVSGIGCACIRVAGITATGRSFTGRQKTLALSLESLGVATAGMIYPHLNSFLLTEYGLRGTCLILGGLLLNSLVSAIIFSYALDINKNYETTHIKAKLAGELNHAFGENGKNDFIKRKHRHTDLQISQKECDSTINPTIQENSVRNYSCLSKSEDGTENDQEKEIHGEEGTYFCEENNDLKGTGIQEHRGECKVGANVLANQVNGNTIKKHTCVCDGTGYKISDDTGTEIQQLVEEIITNSKMTVDTVKDTGIQKHSSISNENGDPTLDKEKATGVQNHPDGWKEQCDTTDLGVQKHASKENGEITIQPVKEYGERDYKDGSEIHYYGIRSLVFIIFLIGTSFVIGCLSGFLTLYQDIMTSKDYTIFQSNIAINCYSVFNFVSRLLPIAPSLFPKLNIFLVPFTAALSGGFAQLFLLLGTSYPMALVGTSLAGLCDGAIMSSLQTIVFQIVKPERQVVGFGLLLSCSGILSTISGPLFGSIKDSTQSYDLVLIICCCIYLSTAGLFLVCVVKSDGRKRRGH